MKKIKNLWANPKSRIARSVVKIAFVASPLVAAFGCGEDKDCSYDLENYNTCKATATADSTTFVNYKEDPPQQFLDIVDAYMRLEGQTYEQAWESALNTALTNPNYSAEVKAWAEQYNVYLNAFNTSVENRQGAYKSWHECEEQK